MTSGTVALLNLLRFLGGLIGEMASCRPGAAEVVAVVSDVGLGATVEPTPGCDTGAGIGITGNPVIN